MTFLSKDFFSFGVEYSKITYIQQKVVTSNYFAVFMSAVPPSYTLLSLIFFPKVAWVCAIAILVPPFVIFLNYVGLIHLSRLIMALLPMSLGIVFVSYILQSNQTSPLGSFAVLFSFMIVPAILFDIRETLPFAFCMIFNISILLFQQQFNLFFDIEMENSFFFSKIYDIITVFVACGVIIGALIALQKININAQNVNIKLVESLNEQNENLKTSREELENSFIALRKAQSQNEAFTWLAQKRSGLTDIFNKHRENFMNPVLSYIVKTLNAQQGLIYNINTDTEKATICATYACDLDKIKNKEVEIGEGNVGQVLQQKKMIHLKKIPDNFLNTQIGANQIKANEILIFPIKNEDRILAILELSTYTTFEDRHIDFLNQTSKDIALKLTLS